ncbi:hypothetical protein [Micrococcus sp.]|uniref:hypothetical protein n=1 Tax=Micrococcus sp. TaxID=1271 RepID=UPI002A91AFF3|nr:hypothetical protein [Micrococcus sp.]MDY6054351.1 hypothetical protein [Micrococcus sp.]
MSDAETTQAEQIASADQEAPEGAREGVQEAHEQELGEGGKRALSAEREARRAAERELSEARAALKEIEDANLSELERAQRDAQEAREELTALRVENARYRVVQAKGVPGELAEFITGDTEEEMAAKADLLLARIPSSPSTPKPDRTQGASAGNVRPVSNAEAFATALGDF